MATLISDIATLKSNFSGIDANFSWASIKSFVEDAERDIIADAIGDEAVTYFQENPNLNDATFQKARSLIMRAEAYLSVLRWSQTAVFRMTDKSLYVAKSSDGAIISDKKLRDLRNYCEENGYRYLDKAIATMEGAIDTFAAYRDGEARQATLQGFITTAADFNAQRRIDNSRLTFISIGAMMLDAQDEYLPPVMGAAWYVDYKSRYISGGLTVAEKKLLPIIKKAVAFLTISRACRELPVKVGAKGLLINRYNNSNEYDQQDPADAARADFMVDDNQDKGQRKLDELKNFLVANATDYPDYIPPATPDVTENDDPCSGIYSM
ncbi:MAG TPA: DUF6712 family protein [Mucilaginibacter sp.]|nr:DUF6712 family protein [Mucilaginibacter sp.]